jgi:hypothetical protein
LQPRCRTTATWQRCPQTFSPSAELAEPFVAQRSSSHRTQLSSCPSRLRRPCSVITQGRSTYGGSWRTCWLWPHSNSTTQ